MQNSNLCFTKPYSLHLSLYVHKLIGIVLFVYMLIDRLIHFHLQIWEILSFLLVFLRASQCFLFVQIIKVIYVLTSMKQKKAVNSVNWDDSSQGLRYEQNLVMFSDVTISGLFSFDRTMKIVLYGALRIFEGGYR